MSQAPIAYQILKTYDDFEVRLYTTETILDANIKVPFIDAGRKGFRKLLRYIRGANRTNQQIAMCKPVLTVPAPASTYVNGTHPYSLQFFLPAPWTVDTAPLPNDSRLTIQSVPARKIAALRYAGFWSWDNFSHYSEKLQNSLKRANLDTVGTPSLARYNSPNWPLWFMRRNEIWIEIS